MANIITAGNSTNGGTAITTDTSGTLNIVTGSGSGVTALSIDASGNVSGVIKSGTAVTSTSGTSIDFTGIPSTTKRITVMFNGVSLNGSSNFLIQLGNGSFVSSGYTSASTYQGSTNVVSNLTSTSGLAVSAASGTSNVWYGAITILNVTGNTWTSMHTIGLYAAATPGYSVTGGGAIALGGTLDRVRITTVNGTDTFDAGTINIIYE